MAAPKRSTKKQTGKQPVAKPVAIDLEPEPELEDLVTMTIEAHAAVDAIEPEHPENKATPPGYRITFHAVLSEEIAQEFFQKFVQDGMVSLEFFPANLTRRTRFEIMQR